MRQSKFEFHKIVQQQSLNMQIDQQQQQQQNSRNCWLTIKLCCWLVEKAIHFAPVKLVQ